MVNGTEVRLKDEVAGFGSFGSIVHTPILAIESHGKRR